MSSTEFDEWIKNEKPFIINITNNSTEKKEVTIGLGKSDMLSSGVKEASIEEILEELPKHIYNYARAINTTTFEGRCFSETSFYIISDSGERIINKYGSIDPFGGHPAMNNIEESFEINDTNGLKFMAFPSVTTVYLFYKKFNNFGIPSLKKIKSA